MGKLLGPVAFLVLNPSIMLIKNTGQIDLLCQNITGHLYFLFFIEARSASVRYVCAAVAAAAAAAVLCVTK